MCAQAEEGCIDITKIIKILLGSVVNWIRLA